MANIINQYGQVKLGVRYTSAPLTSTLWGNVFGVWNADSVGSSSLKTSLFAAYNGESNTNDSFGTNNGTAQGGLTYGTGKIGNAFQFNGTNAVVDFYDNIFNNLTGDFTVSMWINLTSLADRQGFFSNYKYYPTSYEFKGFRIYYGPSGNPSNTGGVRVDIGDGTNPPVNLLTNNYLTTNTWYHIVVTRKFSTSTKIYINGVLSTSNSSTNNPDLSLAYPSLGAAQYDSNLYTWYLSNNSKMDAVNIWTKELTASEVSELYNSGNGAQYITDSFYKPTTNDALNTNNGTPQGGLTYGVGKVGTAFVFNGTTSYVRFPDNAFNSLTGSFSVSAWFKTASSISNVDNFILDNISANAWFNNPNGFYVEQYGNVLNFTIFNNTNTYTELGANYTFSTNTWYHVTATKLANGNMNLYLNGSLVGTKVTSVNPTYLATVSKPCIGALNIPARGSVGYFAQNGFMVDTLNIWTKELTSAEVTELYNSGNGKQYPN